MFQRKLNGNKLDDGRLMRIVMFEAHQLGKHYRLGTLDYLFSSPYLPFVHRRPISWSVFTGEYSNAEVEFQFPVEDVSIPDVNEFLALPNAVCAANVRRVGTALYDGTGTLLNVEDGIATFTTAPGKPLLFSAWLRERAESYDPYIQSQIQVTRKFDWSVDSETPTFVGPGFAVKLTEGCYTSRSNEVPVEDWCSFLEAGGLDVLYKRARTIDTRKSGVLMCSGKA